MRTFSHQSFPTSDSKVGLCAEEGKGGGENGGRNEESWEIVERVFHFMKVKSHSIQIFVFFILYAFYHFFHLSVFFLSFFFVLLLFALFFHDFIIIFFSGYCVNSTAFRPHTSSCLSRFLLLPSYQWIFSFLLYLSKSLSWQLDNFFVCVCAWINMHHRSALLQLIFFLFFLKTI